MKEKKSSSTSLPAKSNQVITQEKERNLSGRPSEINKVDLSSVRFLTENGYTDKQLADIFNVKEQTINNWKIKYPLFFESLKSGKLLADMKVQASLYQRATGYSHPEVHITNYRGKVIRTPIIKHYPPDPVSMIFWLKNRQPNEWRDKHNVEHTGNIGIDVGIKKMLSEIDNAIDVRAEEKTG